MTASGIFLEWTSTSLMPRYSRVLVKAVLVDCCISRPLPGENNRDNAAGGRSSLERREFGEGVVEGAGVGAGDAALGEELAEEEEVAPVVVGGGGGGRHAFF